MQTFLSYMRSALPLLVVALVLGAATYFVAFAVLKKKGRGLPARWKLWLFVSSVYVFALVMLLIVRGEGTAGTSSTNTARLRAASRPMRSSIS